MDIKDIEITVPKYSQDRTRQNSKGKYLIIIK